ncbi:bifunctional metallophosphatase/5'-nucleotidase [Corynebacterium pacaense]|uniref:bifunctional metallophosphatase/5'-nucleotidase n=1 Tax=Corynebacterium pacaense TaxID=1816684 RepID=UPI001FE97121|nr:metallophosphoesterase [Corynebacterium pacaense]
MIKMSRVALAAATIAGLGLGVTAVPATAQDNTTQLNILGITDFHGHIQESKSKDGEVVEAGAAQLACYVDNRRAKNPDTNFVSVGDNVGGSPFVSSILRDKPTLDALNAMDLDVSALGNHEFDAGWADLKDRISLDGTGQAHFPYLGANVTGGGNLPKASTVLTTADGVRIGYVGTVTDETSDLVSPAGIQGIGFTDDVAAVNKEADRLRTGNEADVIVALTHSGGDVA